jgi:hypothetical protein
MDSIVDVIYIVVLVPTLLYSGLKGKKAPSGLFNFSLLLGVLIFIYHFTNLLNLKSDSEYTPLEDRFNTAEVSNNIIN